MLLRCMWLHVESRYLPSVSLVGQAVCPDPCFTDTASKQALEQRSEVR